MLVVPQQSTVVLLEMVRLGLVPAGPQLHLYQNDVTPGPMTVFADFQPCNFPGYGGAQAVAFTSAAFLNDNGNAEIDAAPVNFACAGGVASVSNSRQTFRAFATIGSFVANVPAKRELRYIV